MNHRTAAAMTNRATVLAQRNRTRAANVAASTMISIMGCDGIPIFGLEQRK